MKSGCIILVIFCSLAFSNCKTKPFKKVEVKGKLFDNISKQPIYVSLVLRTDDSHATPGSDVPTVTMISGKTFVDGSFILKSNALRTKNPLYYVYFTNDTLTKYYNLDLSTGKLSDNIVPIPLSENKVNDVGDVYVKW